MKKVLPLVIITILISSAAFAFTTTEVDVEKNKCLVITPENEQHYDNIFSKDKIRVDKVTGLTYKELLDLYNKYSSKNKIDKETLEFNAEEDLNNFVQYMVDNGIIPDSQQAKQDISIAFLRAQFNLAASIGEKLGYEHAADFLRHSLQDDPEDLYFAPGTEVSDWILESDEVQSLISDFQDYVTGRSLSRRFTSGSTILNSDRDYFLALNKVDYRIDGVKSGRRWNLDIDIIDEYDFDYSWEYVDELIATIVNNYAALAEDLGAIVPYDIRINMEDYFYE